jgi:hypothetical protein
VCQIARSIYESPDTPVFRKRFMIVDKNVSRYLPLIDRHLGLKAIFRENG